MPQMVGIRPFKKFNLCYPSGFHPTHSFIFSKCEPLPQRPAVVSGRFAQGRRSVANGLSLFNLAPPARTRPT
jgi:hypothetical protein